MRSRLALALRRRVLPRRPSPAALMRHRLPGVDHGRDRAEPRRRGQRHRRRGLLGWREPGRPLTRLGWNQRAL
eukprot:scaffold32561_cov112-Isochrysis_galbana.AAC.2